MHDHLSKRSKPPWKQNNSTSSKTGSPTSVSMEAEQLNLIENRLADLGQRATELRRYL